MPHVSLLRLYLLRAVYLIIALGLALVVWPGLVHHGAPWGLAQGVVKCMLTAFSLLCILGIRYPLQLLPVLIWEMAWKTLWLLLVALPAWQSGQLDDSIIGTAYECAVAIIIPLALPWRYLIAHYIHKNGDRWRTA